MTDMCYTLVGTVVYLKVQYDKLESIVLIIVLVGLHRYRVFRHTKFE